MADGAISARSGEPGLLCTTSEFADYVLKLEFRSSPQTNSERRSSHAAEADRPGQGLLPVNIAAPDVSPFYTGSFVNRLKASPYQASGDWQSYEVSALAAASSSSSMTNNRTRIISTRNGQDVGGSACNTGPGQSPFAISA